MFDGKVALDEGSSVIAHSGDDSFAENEVGVVCEEEVEDISASCGFGDGLVES